MNKKRVTLLVLAAVLVAALLALLTGPLSRGSGRPKPPAYLTQAVTRGDLVKTITASGTLNPVNQVQVWTQVSGAIKAIHVDFNSQVKKGQLLAELDTASLDADLASSRASLESAQASLKLAKAQLDRNRGLFDQGFIARSELEQSQEKFDTGRAQVRQQEAVVRRNLTNRMNADIQSPVSGVVVSRDVSVGQTVQSSFSTPTLFKIAQDLREMQIEASVSEADIGSVKEGQEVRFTVDAFPDQAFIGIVTQIRNNYAVQQSVVTYTVVVRAQNAALTLRPGMTAYVAVDVARRVDALRIPNAALRFSGPTAATQQPTRALAGRRVWRLLADGELEPVAVVLGLSDGRYTELLGAGLKPGDKLAIGTPAIDTGFKGPKMF
jgi:HlyD family secretion protein